MELGLQLTKTEGQLKAMMLDNPNFLSLQPEIALEFFLLLPQEWDRSAIRHLPSLLISTQVERHEGQAGQGVGGACAAAIACSRAAAGLRTSVRIVMVTR